jgi:MFS family permease
MIILPLYYQVARGETALTAGLLMAPQGLGAALAMPLAGRLTDTLGGGRVAVVGLIVLTLGTIPFAFLDASTSYTLLALLLVVRGLGIGASMMPAMAAAYATLQAAEVPRATSSLNALQRIGGSIGTALLAVVLQGQIADRGRAPAQLADAFAATFWWAVAMSVLALVPATILALTQRRDRRLAMDTEAEAEALVA